MGCHRDPSRGLPAQEDEKGAPWVHKTPAGMVSTVKYLRKLLEVPERLKGTGDGADSDVPEGIVILTETDMPLVHGTYQELVADLFHETDEEPDSDGRVLRKRAVHLYMDGVRVKKVPTAWGKTMCVIRCRLSGFKHGLCQLSGGTRMGVPWDGYVGAWPATRTCWRCCPWP